jgi:outer membrane lipoprotein SlyB
MRLCRHGVCVTLTGLLGLTSCAQPIGPTVQVLPPQGKAYAAFEADERECSLHTNELIGPLVNRAAEAQLGTAAVGTLLGAGIGAAIGGGRGAGIGAAAGALGGAGVGTDQAASADARIQQTYDNTYAACMAAHGDLVTAPPVPQTVVVAPAPYVVPQPSVTTPAQ